MHTIRTSERKRLLLSAHAIAPNRGSEEGVGWHRALIAAREFDTWVICRQQEYQSLIDEWIESNGQVPGLNFVFVPLTPFEERLRRNGFLCWIVNNCWQRRAFRVAIRLHEEYSFDLVHHLTYCSYREPGYMWRMGIPFVWGPVGGTQNYPWRFLSVAGLRGAMLEGARTAINHVQLRFSLRVRNAARQAAFLVAAHSQCEEELKRQFGVKVYLLPDVGVDRVVESDHEPLTSERALRILWIGRFEHRKALPLLLKALGVFKKKGSFELRIVGDGPLKGRWMRLAKRCKIQENTNWLGNVIYEECVAQYKWADIFVFTSLRDTFGTVVLEALSRGVPVVCFDLNGAADVIDESCGVKVPVISPSSAIRALTQILEVYSSCPDRLERLRERAIERARYYLWATNGERMIEIYNKAIAQERVRKALSDGPPESKQSLDSEPI